MYSFGDSLYSAGWAKASTDKIKEQNELQSQEEELMQLIWEIKSLKDINEEKEIKLVNISNEYENLKIKLDELEEKLQK